MGQNREENPSKLIRTKRSRKNVVFHSQTLMWDTCAPPTTLGPAHLNTITAISTLHFLSRPELQHFPLPAPCVAALILTRCDVWYPFPLLKLKIHSRLRAHKRPGGQRYGSQLLLPLTGGCLDRMFSSVL